MPQFVGQGKAFYEADAILQMAAWYMRVLQQADPNELEISNLLSGDFRIRKEMFAAKCS